MWSRACHCLLFLGLLPGGALYAADPPTHAALIEIAEPIGPATSSYFQKAQAAAAASGASVIVLRLDTPGGLDSSMREIIKAILASPLPVVGYVAPGGARAASAGTYILYACHIAAMAPATNLGAATPVPVGGSWPAGGNNRPDGNDGAGDKGAQEVPPMDALERKVLNDAVAYIRGLAQQRGRNADWAETAVRAGRSLPAEEALKLKVIDLIVDDVPDLLRRIDGRRVAVGAGEVVLKTAGLAVEKIAPDWRERLLAVITNPTVAYALMLVGIYGLLVEGYHPGAILPGMVGAICLLVALYAFQVLPVNYVGFGLILLGVALMIAEALNPSIGALGIGGFAAFVLGSILLFDTGVPGYGVDLGLIAGLAMGAASVLALTLYLLWRARRAPVVTGDGGLIGQTAEMLETIDGEGWARVAGERWRVRSATSLAAGALARVTRVDGLLLHVEPLQKT